jgi:hypothetical protein
MSKILKFKIILKNIRPMVWREIEIPENYDFFEFAIAIINAFGWKNSHLYQFEFENFQDNEFDSLGLSFLLDDKMPGEEDVRKYKVKKVFEKFNLKKIDFIYDMGDYWEHEVEFLGEFEKEKNVKYPRCTDGKNACPPEDCGGIYGYEDLKDVLKTGKGKKYKELKGWLEFCDYENFDPKHFNKEEVLFDDANEILKEMLGVKKVEEKENIELQQVNTELKKVWNPDLGMVDEFINLPLDEVYIGSGASFVDISHMRYYMCYEYNKKFKSEFIDKSKIEDWKNYIQSKTNNISILEKVEIINKYIVYSVGIHIEVPPQQLVNLYELLTAKYTNSGCFLTSTNKPEIKELNDVFKIVSKTKKQH